MPQTAIDPLEGPKFALAGRIVVMDSSFSDIPRGVLYGESGGIVAVQDEAAPPPAGFEAVSAVETGGTLFPGLIELHNHLSYNALRLWDVPKKFTNRDQWGGTAEYRRLVSGPMQVLGGSSTLMPAVVRYVECKSLLGGVTTSQGIALFSNRGARRYYRGLVRNVEQTDEPDFPEAATRIADVDAVDAQRFLARLLKQTCFLLHLSEGTDTAARDHFLALHIAPRQWAITDTLAGIHCAALRKADLSILANRGGAMVWSPLSNLLLYGETARIDAAKTEGVRIGLGSDWSPTGSKNLLGELKAAFLASEAAGSPFSDRDIVAMATRDAAAILKWETVLGSLEPGKRADVLVLEGKRGDPYRRLLGADERSIRLLLINGVPRMGLPSLMAALGATGESIRVGGRRRLLNLKQKTADPVVGELTLGEARDALRDGLRRLPELALAQETAPERTAVPGRAVASEPLTWFLALDELADTGVELRPRLPLPGRRAFTGPELRAAAEPLSTLLHPLQLDPLTVADDEDFLARIAAQRNLPPYVPRGLRELYPG